MTLDPLLTAPPLVLVHAGLGLAALGLGLVQLALAKGTLRHRIMGWLWAMLLAGAAGTSLGLFQINDGSPSLLHILSLAALIYLPFLIRAARAGRVGNHLRIAYGLMIGVVLVAFASTFMPGRMMHSLLFGVGAG